jgi:hypothetical protein
MARSGSSIETRIAFEGSEVIKKQLADLASAGEKALSDLQKHFGVSKNPFSALSGGADETRRHFDNLAASSQRAGNTVRASLVSAVAGTSNFSTALNKTGLNSRNLQYSLTNLSFQLNDVFTGLASGQDPMRIFAQQSGQIFQIFQTGGGPRVLLGAAATAIKGLISPTLLAGAAIGALAVGFGILIARAMSSDQSAKSFDITLKALGKSSQITGAELEAAAQGLRDVGLNAAEGRAAIHKALVEGVRPQDAQRIVRIGANVAAALGEGTEGIDRFTAAAAKGGPALQEYAEKLGIIPKTAKAVQDELKRSAQALDEASAANRKFNDILSNRTQSIIDQRREAAQSEADIERQTSQQLADLTRQRGTAEEELKLSARRQSEELELQSQRRVVEINRQTNRQINELMIERNRENAKRLAEFNKRIEESAQEAAKSSPAVLKRIEEQTRGAARELLSPVGRALQDLGIAWDALITRMSQSSIIQGAVKALEGLVNLLTTGFKSNVTTTIIGIVAGIAGIGLAVKIVLPIFAALSGGVTAIIAGFTALVSGAGAVAAGMLAIVAFIGWPAILLAGIVALVASFVDWKDVLSGKTWSDFIGTIKSLWNMLEAIAGYLTDTFLGMWNATWQGIKDGFNAVVQFFAQQVNIIKSFFVDLGKTISDALSKAFGAAAGGSIPAIGLASGGPIFGPSGTDRVPIWATAGEYMVRKSSVDYLGVGFMNMINRFPEKFDQMMRGFSIGGIVGEWGSTLPRDSFASGGAIQDIEGGSFDRVAIDLAFPDGTVFKDMLAPREVAGQFGRYAGQRRRSAIGRRPSWHSGRIGG